MERPFFYVSRELPNNPKQLGCNMLSNQDIIKTSADWSGTSLSKDLNRIIILLFIRLFGIPKSIDCLTQRIINQFHREGNKVCWIPIYISLSNSQQNFVHILLSRLPAWNAVLCSYMEIFPEGRSIHGQTKHNDKGRKIESKTKKGHRKTQTNTEGKTRIVRWNSTSSANDEKNNWRLSNKCSERAISGSNASKYWCPTSNVNEEFFKIHWI